MIYIDLSEDKRKYNGGNSTKPKRLDDKRLSPGRRLLNQYINENVTPEKLKTLFEKLYEKGKKDTRAASLYLSYVLGKPKESLDLTSGDEPIRSGFNLSTLSEEELQLVLKLHGRDSTDTDD